MIRVIHSFGVRNKPIGKYPPISGKISSISGYGSSANPPQDMVLPSEVFYKTSIRLPNQDSFEHKLTNTQSSPLKKMKTSPMK